jgi:membrane-associated protein
VFAGAAGIPLPASLLLLAAGALVSQGRLHFGPAVATALLAAVLGDCVAYGIGRVAGRALLERLAPRLHLPPTWLATAERAFSRWGGGAIWLTRWLLPSGRPAVSALAGTEAYPFSRFVAFAVAGEILRATGYVGLGWLSADRLPHALALLARFSWSASAVAVASVLVFLGWRLAARRASVGWLRAGARQQSLV